MVFRRQDVLGLYTQWNVSASTRVVTTGMKGPAECQAKYIYEPREIFRLVAREVSDVTYFEPKVRKI